MKEYPCEVCGKQNDIGVEVCWHCGGNPHSVHLKLEMKDFLGYPKFIGEENKLFTTPVVKVKEITLSPVQLAEHENIHSFFYKKFAENKDHKMWNICKGPHVMEDYVFITFPPLKEEHFVPTSTLEKVDYELELELQEFMEKENKE